jgi:hypothetical protein
MPKELKSRSQIDIYTPMLMPHCSQYLRCRSSLNIEQLITDKHTTEYYSAINFKDYVLLFIEEKCAQSIKYKRRITTTYNSRLQK